MPRTIARRAWISFAVAFLIALAPLPSVAQSGFSAADNAVFKAYVLDAGKVNRFIVGLNALAMAKQMDDAIAEDYERMDNEDGTSLAQLRAKLTRHPRIFAFWITIRPLSCFSLVSTCLMWFVASATVRLTQGF